MQKVNIAAKFALFSEQWSPKILGEVNDVQVKVARLQGSFEWHAHAEEDELFLVVEGRLQMRFRDHDVWLEAGEMIVVPRGVEHLPVAPEETKVVLIEQRGTRNTGGEETERTVVPEWI